MSSSCRLLGCWLAVLPSLTGIASGTLQESLTPRVHSIDAVATEVYSLIEATHSRVEFDSDVTRFAVGRSQTLSVEGLNSRELLVLGQEPGRTSLIVWFEDGSTQSLLFSVLPDLSLLGAALADIHPSISVALAPDRHAFVLRGLVPDVVTRQAAESAAAAYLESSEDRGESTPLVTPASGESEAPGAETVRAPEEPPRSAVINLIRVETLPPRADEKIRLALEPLVGESVTVRRILSSDQPNDENDLFVLEGTVPDQVTLTKALFLASRVVVGDQASERNEIRVLADEAGGLTNVQNIFGAGAIGGGANQPGLSIGGSAAGGSNGQRGGQGLRNRIGANLGRAKVIEAASGRILAMISVKDLPLIRVDVRLYEVNLTRLRQWRNELGIAIGDFDQGSLNPSPLASALQGSNAASIGQDDVQNVLGFIDGGLSNQLQLVSGGFAVDDLFQLLVSEEVARALSRPSLTVLSGEQALFQVGGQVPVPIAVTVGGGTDQVLNSITFRDFGVQLAVRPLVEELDSETITLDVEPTVSLPDLELTAAIGAASGTGTGTTAFETRGARTHTRLLDGQSMLIGGLISQRKEEAEGKTPWLGDLPLAGWLFRNEATSSEDFELVIVVNPVIVRPKRSDARLWSFVEPSEVLAACLEEVCDDREAIQASPDSRREFQDSGTSRGPEALSQ